MVGIGIVIGFKFFIAKPALTIVLNAHREVITALKVQKDMN